MKFPWSLAASCAIDGWSASERQRVSTAGTCARYQRVLEAFVRFAEIHDVANCAGVTASLCSKFVYAPLKDGTTPSPSTSRLRLSVLRGAFATWIGASMTSHDPTAGMRVAERGSEHAGCPLSPVEVTRLEACGRASPTDTLRPAAVTLALCGASHAEISMAVVADLDESGLRVCLGRAIGTPHWAALSPAGQQAMATRLNAQRQAWRRRGEPWDPALVPLGMHRLVSTYPASSVAPTVSMNLSRALVRAGITRPAVRPRSLREFAANRTYAITRRIEDVATQLGLSSLDTASKFIDPDWQELWANAVRQSVDG